jgi:hypothetical protein
VNSGVKPIRAPAEQQAGVSQTSGASQVPVVDSVPHDLCRYCPICSTLLESRRCKLICTVCGYYMSCADYY